MPFCNERKAMGRRIELNKYLDVWNWYVSETAVQDDFIDSLSFTLKIPRWYVLKAAHKRGLELQFSPTSDNEVDWKHIIYIKTGVLLSTEAYAPRKVKENPSGMLFIALVVLVIASCTIGGIVIESSKDKQSPQQKWCTRQGLTC